MKTLVTILLTAMTAGSFSLTGCSDKKHSEGSADEVMAVDVACPAVDSIILRKQYPGYLTPNKELDVVARASGILTGKYFTDGQYVTEGTLLFAIEDTSYRDALNQANAQLETARSNISYCERQFNAMKEAFKSDAVSQMDVIKAENAYNQALASEKSAAAAVRTAQTNLGYCQVRALCNGHIASPSVDVGEYVGGDGGAIKLTTIYDDSSVSASFSVEGTQYLTYLDNKERHEVDLNNIPVTFEDSLPHSYTGYLDYMAPDIDKSTGSLALRVKIDNPHGDLKSGMYSVIHLPYADLPDALLIKDSAISTDRKGKYVYVVNDSNKVVYTPIEVGDLYNDTLRVVNAGLKPSDRYVTRALLKVKPGMTVKPVITK